MPRTGAIVSALAFVILTMSPPAVTPRNAAADRAGMCDAYDGVAFTFCVAYCEARECDTVPIGDERCALIRRGFARVTGGATPPCAAGGEARSL
jgi:hypothetical protein